MTKMTLISSNKKKISEFRRILPNINVESGKDIKEVMGNIDEVILYKALEAKEGQIVEDTILKINGKEVVDIRWNQEDKLIENAIVEWIVSLGYNTGKEVKVYRGIVKGVIVKPDIKADDFDPFFLPDGSDKTLYELDLINKKEDFSARSLALLNLVNNVEIFRKKINEIPQWEGKYQNS